MRRVLWLLYLLLALRPAELANAQPGGFNLVQVRWSIPLNSVAGASGVCEFSGGTNLTTRLFLVQQGSEVRAIDPLTGRAAWPITKKDEGFLLPSAVVNSHPVQLGAAISPTHWVGLISGTALGTQLDPLQLVCLDMICQGQVVWAKSPVDVMQQFGWDFSGHMITGEGLTCVVLISDQNPDELSVASLNTVGEIRWLTHIRMSGANRALKNFESAQFVFVEATGQIGLVTGTDWFLFDHETGQVQRRYVISRDDSPSSNPQHIVAGLYGSTLVRACGRQLAAWDTADARELWKIDLPEAATTFIGQSGTILLIGGNGVCAADLNTGILQWHFAPLLPAFQGSGRGVVANGQLLWPTRDELLIMQPQTGDLLRRHPLRVLTGFGGGSVTLKGETLLVLSRDRLTAYRAAE